MNREEFERAYRNTTYQVEGPDGDFSFRIGELNPSLDGVLDRLKAREWAFITPYNPRSEQVPREENMRRMDELRSHLEELGLPLFPARGVDDDGTWPSEEGFFIPDLPRPVAAGLGRQYQQNAVVVGHRGGGPELLFCAI